MQLVPETTIGLDSRARVSVCPEGWFQDHLLIQTTVSRSGVKKFARRRDEQGCGQHGRTNRAGGKWEP